MWTLLALLAAALAASPAHAAVEVVCTLADLAALAREVGGPDVHVTHLVEPDQDAHYVDARPSLVLPLARAGLLVVNGLELEVGWLPPLLASARNPAIGVGAAGYLDVSAFVRRLQVPQGAVSRSQGDVHPGGNPHFLHDPRAAAAVARALAARLGALDPPRAAAHRARGEATATALLAFAAAERARFDKLPAAHKAVVTYHQSLIYLADWLGLEQVATVEPLPGIPPHPAHVGQVLQTMRARSVRALLQEPYYPRNASQTLAKLSGARLVVVPGGAAASKGETYLARSRRTAEAIHAALQP